MLALIAMLLVAVGGSPRGAQHRVSAGAGNSIAAPHPGRHVAAVAPSANDQVPWHLDLATTPTVEVPKPSTTVADQGNGDTTTYVGSHAVAEVGRAPPTL